MALALAINIVKVPTNIRYQEVWEFKNIRLWRINKYTPAVTKVEE
jgi:hypothetical protein